MNTAAVSDFLCLFRSWNPLQYEAFVAVAALPVEGLVRVHVTGWRQGRRGRYLIAYTSFWLFFGC